jgi:hypothetical protein
MTSPVDTLTSNDVKELLCDKYILILGDSGKPILLFISPRKIMFVFLVIRGLYKDLIKFSNSDDLVSEEELRIKVIKIQFSIKNELKNFISRVKIVFMAIV